MFLGHLKDQKAIDRFFYLCKQLFPDVKVIEEDGNIHAEETLEHQKQGLRYLFTGFNFGYNLNRRIDDVLLIDETITNWNEAETDLAIDAYTAVKQYKWTEWEKLDKDTQDAWLHAARRTLQNEIINEAARG